MFLRCIITSICKFSVKAHKPATVTLLFKKPFYMQISTGLALRSWKGFLSIFFPCHPAESISGPDETSRVECGFHRTNIFIISHSWRHRSGRNNTFTGVCFELCPPKGVRNNTDLRLITPDYRRTTRPCFIDSHKHSVVR